MSEYRIAVIGGDGVGPEVVAAGMGVLGAAASGFSLAWEHLPWGSDYYQANGVMMPADGLDVLERFDAIYLGAVGRPDVPDHVTLWGLLLPIRQRFDLYLNVRPVRLLPGVLSPLRDRGPADIDMIVVRENSEGEYAGVGGRAHGPGDPPCAAGLPAGHRAGAPRVLRRRARAGRDPETARAGRARRLVLARWRSGPLRTGIGAGECGLLPADRHRKGAGYGHGRGCSRTARRW